jgi:putative ABC transport system permease protein
VRSVDADLPVAKLAPLENLVSDSMTADRFAMLLISGFGALALILACVGMYSVISYSVTQRTPEIGIRIALGAQRREVFLMILRQGSYIAGYGIALGLLAALASTRLMTRFLFGVSPTDPLTFASVALLMITITLLACYIPARKATQVDPMIALRYE